MAFTKQCLIAASITLCIWCALEDILIDLRYLKPELLSDVIGSDELCPYIKGDSPGLVVSVDHIPYSLPFLKAKVSTFFDKNHFVKFWIDQLNFSHFSDEVILGQRFVVSAVFAIFCIGSIEMLILKTSNNRRTADSQLTTIGTRFKSFLHVKFMVILLCIPQNYTPVVYKKYTNFGDFVQDKLSIRTRTTDLTIFAAWYCLLSVVHSTTYPVMLRVIEIGSPLPGTMLSKLARNSSILILFLTLFSLMVISCILFGTAILSFAFLHPALATILFLESYQAWIQSLFALFNVSVKLSNPPRTTQETTRKLKNPLITSAVWGSFLLNILYGVIGLIYNRKMFAVGFILRAAQGFDLSFSNVEDLFELL